MSHKKPLPATTGANSAANRQHGQALSDFSKRKREQIINAALETFFELGYEGATMNLVAERAGVIKQTIYSHFDDKEGLFISVISSVSIDHVQHVFTKQAIETQTPEQILRAFAQMLVSRQFDPTFSKLFRTILGESARFPKLAELYTRATIKPGCELLASYLKNHPEIHLADPEAFARIFAGALINHCIQQYILHGKDIFPFEFSRIVDELIRLFNLSNQER